MAVNVLESDRNQATALLDRSDNDTFGAIEMPHEDVTGKAIQVCQTWLLRPFHAILIGLGWMKPSRCGTIFQVCIVLGYIVAIIATFVFQGLVCFQRDLLFLTKEKCVTNNETDRNLICCSEHFISAFVIPDVLIMASYIFGLYHFSTPQEDNVEKLSVQVFITMARELKGKATSTEPLKETYPRKLIGTIGAFLLAGLAWIALSAVVKIMYLKGFKYIGNNDIKIFWMNDTNNKFIIEGSLKDGFIAVSMFGFIFFDVVYIATVMNYAIQSELIVSLLKSISKLTESKSYESLEEVIKNIREVEGNIMVLNGTASKAVSLVAFQLFISTVIALEQLDMLTHGRTVLSQVQDLALSYAVALLSILLWLGVVVFVLVQASRVTDGGLGLKKSAAYARSQLFQYSDSNKSDLDSFVSYVNTINLRATLFGVPLYPWMLHAAAVIILLLLILLARTDLYSPLPKF